MSTAYAVMQSNVVGSLLRLKRSVTLNNRPSCWIDFSTNPAPLDVEQGDIALALQNTVADDIGGGPSHYIKVLTNRGEVGWINTEYVEL